MFFARARRALQREARTYHFRPMTRAIRNARRAIRISAAGFFIARRNDASLNFVDESLAGPGAASITIREAITIETAFSDSPILNFNH